MIDLFLEINDTFKLEIVSKLILFLSNINLDYYISQCILKYSNLNFKIFSKIIMNVKLLIFYINQFINLNDLN